MSDFCLQLSGDSPSDADTSASIQTLMGYQEMPRWIARLLVARGITSLDALQEYLNVPATVMHSPWLMKGMQTAVETLLKWRGSDARICVFGDYDLDGISGAALMFLALERATGWKLERCLPSRFEDGYGLSERILRQLYEEHEVRGLVLIDTGISAVDEIALARQLGMDVVVIDHHRPSGQEIPDATAILNPWQAGCEYPHKDLSAVGVALKAVQALYETIDLGGIETFWDLVSLGTLSDLMPLLGENRLFVQTALRRMGRSDLPGIRLLAESTMDAQGHLRSQDILFRIAPLMNAPGRLDRPDPSLDLLLAHDEQEAYALIQQLRRSNETRKDIEQQVTQQALQCVKQYADQSILVVDGQNWHLGVLGIVASKLVQLFQKPVAVVSHGSDGVSRASARSVPGFNWHHLLQENREFFDRWGGHAAAAGFQFPSHRISALRKAFAHYAQSHQNDPWVANHQAGLQVIECHLEIPLLELDEKAMEWLQRLEPFGRSNPNPVLVSRVKLAQGIRELRGGHLQFTVKTDASERTWPAIAFGMSQYAPWLRQYGQAFRLAYEPQWNFFNGHRSLQLHVKGFDAL